MIKAAMKRFVAKGRQFVERWDPEGLAAVQSPGIARINIRPLPEFYFDFDSLAVVSETDATRAHVQGDAANLVRYFMKEESSLTITGDLLWLNDRIKAIQALDVSFEDALNDMLPDPVAAPTAMIFKRLLHASKTQGERLSAGIADNLQYERRWLATKADVAQFCQAVDEFVMRLDRFEAKLNLRKRNEVSR